MALISDRCQSNGNDHLSNFDTLKTTCLHLHTALTSGTILKGCDGNQRIMLHEKIAFDYESPLKDGSRSRAPGNDYLQFYFRVHILQTFVSSFSLYY